MSGYKLMGCEIRGLQADYSKESLDISDVHCLNVRSRIWLLVIYVYIYIYINTHTYTHIHIQGVPGGKDLTSGECSLGQTITI